MSPAESWVGFTQKGGGGSKCEKIGQSPHIYRLWITPVVKSEFNTVKHALGKTGICSELTLEQLWAE